MKNSTCNALKRPLGYINLKEVLPDRRFQKLLLEGTCSFSHPSHSFSFLKKKKKFLVPW